MSYLCRGKIDMSTAYSNLNSTQISVSRVACKSKNSVNFEILNELGILHEKLLLCFNELVKIGFRP
jgi:hypothetical protein